MTQDERLARIRLARTAGIGPLTFRRLLERFGRAIDATAALPELARETGRDVALAPESEVERELNRLHKRGAQMLVLGEPAYPELLAELDDAPPVLAVQGDPAVLARRAIGVVGARNASANGRRMAEVLSAELAGEGLLVVSGLARGVDAAAHRGALQMGLTCAAIAGGLDMPYPAENAELQAAIAAAGAVVAEAPLGTAPQSRHFPRRNRIIAGLSLGVVVVEAARHSGSLITAQLALDANRAVMAVPGSPLDPRCAGSNDLIRSGATLVGETAHVLEALAEWSGQAAPAPAVERPAAPPQPPVAADGLPGQLLTLLSRDPAPVDDLIRRCQLPASSVMSALLTLEMEGVVELLPGHRVVLIG